MSKEFREFLRKIGSGTHTHENLTRAEAQTAMRLMLLQEATPAQIGAFLIAHRIKRPTSAELAGMLDAYADLGPQLATLPQNPLVLGSPYDGRSRSVPLSPLTALVLAAAGRSVILHGGDRMPTKEGIPLIDVWQALGVDWRYLSLSQIDRVLITTGIGFVYLPRHFPLAHGLVTFRDQIGKRPPLATVEMLWAPYAGESHVVTGFVHPPTETIMRECFALQGKSLFTTIKGVEGSCDLPRDRTAIVGLGQERGLFSPLTYGFGDKEVPIPEHLEPLFAALWRGEAPELHRSVVWTSGFYLWRSGLCTELALGHQWADRLLKEGKVIEKLTALQQACQDLN